MPSSVELDASNTILVFGGQLSFGGRFGSIDFVLKEFAGTQRSGRRSRRGTSSALVDLLGEFPATLVREQERGTVVTHSNDGTFRHPDQISAGEFGIFSNRSSRLARRDISNAESRVVPYPSEEVARRGPFARLHPPIRVDFSKKFSEGKFGTKRSVGSLGVHSFDVCGEDTAFEVTGGSGQKSVIRMPVNLQDS